MAFTFDRLISFLDSKKRLQEALEGVGLDQHAAHKAAFEMSPGDISQVQKDLYRAPLLRLNRADTSEETDDFDVSTLDKAQAFLDLITEDEKKQAYLKKFMHQGGFMHAAEMLLTYYFRTAETDDQMLMLDTDNRVFDIQVEKNGDITFVESFDIPSIKTVHGQTYNPANGPVASVSMSSTLRLNEAGELEHQFEDIKINSRDKASKHLFKDTSGPFVKFVKWVQDKLLNLFSKAAKQQNAELEKLPKPRHRL